jgi:acetylornithine/LysW-gamma-L-lysine aminotransferase
MELLEQHISQQNIAEIENGYTSGAYAKRPLTIVRGNGCYVYDEQGNEYLDMTSGVGVAALGHAHPALTQAISQQAQTLITCSEAFYNDRRAELYGVLAQILPSEIGRFFLCNSGTEAVEGALKIARLLTGRSGIISTKRAFHGRTLGALATTWNPSYREPFEGWTPPTTHITYGDFNGLELITSQTGAVIVEAVQGEGGIYPANWEWLRELRRVCTAEGALLIMDEIQAGLGRSGKWFAFQHADIVPDIITLGKAIAGGVPMGAVAWRSILGTIESGTHGSTFGGNPLACAASIACLRELQAMNAPQQSAELGAWLLDELRSRNLAGVREIRGIGLMIGIELKGRVTPILQALQERGILALLAGKTVLRLLPPLIVTRNQLEHVVDMLAEVLQAKAEPA